MSPCNLLQTDQRGFERAELAEMRKESACGVLRWNLKGTKRSTKTLGPLMNKQRHALGKCEAGMAHADAHVRSPVFRMRGLGYMAGDTYISGDTLWMRLGEAVLHVCGAVQFGN